MQNCEAKQRAAEDSSIPYLSASPPQLDPELNLIFFSFLPLPGILMKQKVYMQQEEEEEPTKQGARKEDQKRSLEERREV
jgi:hypothetical protein